MTATWSDLETAAPDLATEGRRLIYARGDGEALLATVRGDDLPRIHPVNVAIVDGRLYVFVIARSPKRGDLEADAEDVAGAGIAVVEVELGLGSLGVPVQHRPLLRIPRPRLCDHA